MFFDREGVISGLNTAEKELVLTCGVRARCSLRHHQSYKPHLTTLPLTAIDNLDQVKKALQAEQVDISSVRIDRENGVLTIIPWHINYQDLFLSPI